MWTSRLVLTFHGHFDAPCRPLGAPAPRALSHVLPHALPRALPRALPCALARVLPPACLNARREEAERGVILTALIMTGRSLSEDSASGAAAL